MGPRDLGEGRGDGAGAGRIRLFIGDGDKHDVAMPVRVECRILKHR